MTDLKPEICFRLKEERRRAGLSQSVLAAELGCKQSALSMFEQGDGTKLNDEVIERYAAKFGVDLKSVDLAPVVIPPSAAMHTGFCPNPHCPSNTSYAVDGRKLYLPDRAKADPAGGRFCVMCGELLERKCPVCGADVHDGAICSFCGSPYITA